MAYVLFILLFRHRSALSNRCAGGSHLGATRLNGVAEGWVKHR